MRRRVYAGTESFERWSSLAFVVAIQGGLLDLDGIVDADLFELRRETSHGVHRLAAVDDFGEYLLELAVHVIHDRRESPAFVLRWCDRRHLALVGRSEPRLQRVLLGLQLVVLHDVAGVLNGRSVEVATNVATHRLSRWQLRISHQFVGISRLPTFERVAFALDPEVEQDVTVVAVSVVQLLDA